MEGRNPNMALVVDLVVMLGVWLLSMVAVIEGSCAINPDDTYEAIDESSYEKPVLLSNLDSKQYVENAFDA